MSVVGGGPGGLYLAILLKKRRPDISIDVFERNQPGDAYGFGVVFSDETLEHFHEADGPTYKALTQSFIHWGDIEIRHFADPEPILSGGHGFAAASRKALLELLTERADELGVNLHFGADITSLAEVPPADLVVAADGANSLIRTELEHAFVPTIVPRVNKYIWFGTPKVFDRFHFIFEDTEHGMIWAHIYPYDQTGSTFIVEMAPDTWKAHGFDVTESHQFGLAESDQVAIAKSQELFAEHLDGYPLLGNKSRWLQFPEIKCERWHHENVVLIGDAAHTAHFSIGSGTKLAMEDAIALVDQLAETSNLTEALESYEEERRPAVDSIQRAAKASLEWFEGADRYRGLHPTQFGFSLLTRSQRVTYDNLRLRDAEYMSTVDHWYADHPHGSLKRSRPPSHPCFIPMR